FKVPFVPFECGAEERLLGGPVDSYLYLWYRGEGNDLWICDGDRHDRAIHDENDDCRNRVKAALVEPTLYE
uniref:MHC class II antigen n=1 Tax=Romanomermis culicivorax TaxID=13658 RepID=A0A915IG42_ROMCU